MLSGTQLKEFQERGHVTIPHVLTTVQLQELLDDLETWSREFLAALDEDKRKWFVESESAQPILRKLDNPAFHRPAFRRIATSLKLTTFVEQLIGADVSVFFSQVFCKPPEVGGAKPVHQDNYYFGPDDPNATLTVWIALDEATVENGCLYYGDGSHTGPVYGHVAPVGEPFNLQIVDEHRQHCEMTPAPVPAGGVSFHHGNTWHQSSANTSPDPRRAVVFHYLRNGNRLRNPALEYDSTIVVDAGAGNAADS